MGSKRLPKDKKEKEALVVEKKPLPKRGRTLARIDWNVVRSMLEVGCVGTEVAAAMGVNPQTLYDRCQRDQGKPWQEYLQECQSALHFRLRGMQVKKALGYWVKNPNTGKQFYIEPDTSLLIFLGKQLLGQTEKVETRHTIHGYVIEDEDGNVIEDTTHQVLEETEGDDEDF